MDKNPSLSYTETDINLFISRFSTGHWGRQCELNRAKAATRYQTGDKCHLNSTLVINHLSRKETLAVYVITDGNECKFAVLDFDANSAVVKSHISDPASEEGKKAYQEAMTEVKETVANAISGLSSSLKIKREQLLLEYSGSKGYHIWMFFENPVPTRSAYRMTQVIARELDLEGVELFPGQEYADAEHPGDMIKLPLSINRKTGLFCGFVDDNFEYLEDQWKALREVQPISNTELENILKLQEIQVKEPEFQEGEDLSLRGGSIESMFTKCEALSNIQAKSRSVDPDAGIINLTNDERVCILSLLKQFGIPGANKIHDLLSECHNYSKETTDYAINNTDIKPMRCATMYARGICPYENQCDVIRACRGTSPIKLSGYSKKQSVMHNLKSLSQIENTILCGKDITVDFTVSAIVNEPYYSHTRATFAPCSESCPKFGLCEREDKETFKTVNIPKYDKMHIQVYGEKDEKVIDYTKKQLVGCLSPRSLKLSRETEKVLIQPFMCGNRVDLISSSIATESDNPDQNAENLSEAKEYKDYLAFCMQNSLESSKSYRGKGVVMANPQNQNITIMFTEVTPLTDQIDNFQLDDATKERLNIYSSMSIDEKIRDLRDNVLHIYSRDSVITAVLLSFCSPLAISFNGNPTMRGRLDVLLVGDSGQAKSLLVTRMCSYSGVGRIASSNSTTAGLIGGIDRTSNGSFMSWGLLPKSDRGLVFLDEVQNISPETMSQLRTIRTNGEADVTKIKGGKHPARIRLICAANPIPNNRTVAEFKYGIQALATVMQAPDLRRFDLGCVLSGADIDSEEINVENSDNPPILKPEVLAAAFYRIWSLTPDDIIISKELTSKILKKAGEVSDKFDNNVVPLCNTADMREKLCRIVVSAAGLRGAFTDNYSKLVPEQQDLDFAVNLLDQIYANSSANMDGLAEERRNESELSDDQKKALDACLATEEYKDMWNVICKIASINSTFYMSDIGASLGLSGVDTAKIQQKLMEFQMIGMGKQSRSLELKSKLTKYYNYHRQQEKLGNDKGPQPIAF